jgi:hypothetical protein
MHDQNIDMGKQTRIEYSAVWTTIRPDLIDHPD